MLGDTGIAVHPNDLRWSSFIGRSAVNPLTGKEMPIVAHDSVNIDLGTGAVKLTPAHSPDDYVIAAEMNLPSVNILTNDGRLNESVGADWSGRHRFEVRDDLIGRLSQLGLFVGSEPHKINLPVCSRSKDVVEPVLKEQWFAKCSGELSNIAADALSFNLLKIYPDNFTKEWDHWMRKCNDWCLSRQLLWGHRVPAYFVYGNSNETLGYIIARSETEAMYEAVKKYPNINYLKQDEDVLDTWFSSSLLPLSQAGWPQTDFNKTRLNAMQTGHDILFFWVSKMYMMSMALTGTAPFDKVILNGLICDKKGKKMSKSAQNSIDPMLFIHGKGSVDTESLCTSRDITHLGADSLRFGLLSNRFQQKDVSFDPLSVMKSHQFLNKLWQSHRFLRSQLNANMSIMDVNHILSNYLKLDLYSLDVMDRWILSRLALLCSVCVESHRDNELHFLVSKFSEFWIADYCDIYLECIKKSCDKTDRLMVAYLVSVVFLRMLHPYCPHITELLWLALHADLSQSSCILLQNVFDGDLLDTVGSRFRSTGLEDIVSHLVELISRINNFKSLLLLSKEAYYIVYDERVCPLNMKHYFTLFTALAKTSVTSVDAQHKQDVYVFELMQGLSLHIDKQLCNMDEAVLKTNRAIVTAQKKVQRLMELQDRASESERQQLSRAEKQLSKYSEMLQTLQRQLSNKVTGHSSQD